jgi:SAM-dependent methyltransferase
MEDKFYELTERLRCPDDWGELNCKEGNIECGRCGRVYPILRGDILEILPSRPAKYSSSPNQEYACEYDREFREVFEIRESAMAWGAPEVSPPAWTGKRERQVSAVLSHLMRDGKRLRDIVLCDVSAGSGHYTLASAHYFKWVLHCDLSVDNLNYAIRRSVQMGISNVLFLRVDYFRLPFVHSLDRILCFDTLIRGKDHEKALLQSIHKALRPQGEAIVDFHNWWHNPLRRLGLLRQNFGQNRSYARGEAEALLRDSGITQWEVVRFYQEFDPENSILRAFSRFIPATRLMFEFSGSGDGTA